MTQAATSCAPVSLSPTVGALTSVDQPHSAAWDWFVWRSAGASSAARAGQFTAGTGSCGEVPGRALPHARANSQGCKLSLQHTATGVPYRDATSPKIRPLHEKALPDQQTWTCAMTYCGDETGGLVLDIGSATTKFGFAGEDMPKVVFPSVVGSRRSEEGGSRFVFGDGALRAQPCGTQILQNYLDGNVCDWEMMEATIRYAYTQLSVKSREHPLLLVDPAIANSMQPQREKFVELLFERFSVPALYLARSAVLSAFSAGRSTAMVIDVGAASTRVCSVFEGYLLQKTSNTSQLGGNRMDAELLRLLEEGLAPAPLLPRYAFKKKVTGGAVELTRVEYDVGDVHPSYELFMKLEIAREIKESLCSVSPVPLRYVSPSVLAEPAAASGGGGGGGGGADEVYELPDGTKFSTADVEYKVPELLFDPLPLMLPSVAPLSTMINDRLKSCDAEIRKELCSNLLVVGGGAAFKGVGKRLSNELASLIPMAFKVKVLEGGTLERRFAPFIGGSIMASLGTFQQLWMSKLEYEEEGPGGIERRCP